MTIENNFNAGIEHMRKLNDALEQLGISDSDSDIYKQLQLLDCAQNAQVVSFEADIAQCDATSTD